jgi:hypothetical protein
MTQPDRPTFNVKDTYLTHCLKNGKLLRWADKAMPIQVYIAPFNWHEASKQQNRYLYSQMVQDSFKHWTTVCQGKVSFQFVTELRQSQINVLWRPVDRNTLGHCEYMFTPQGELYSAEIQIGLSDGRLHPQYNTLSEVRHTVLHEIGHALGIAGHSDQSGDIMYVPHEYGVVAPSERDVATMDLLYRLPVGFDYAAVAPMIQTPAPITFNRVAARFLKEPEHTTTPSTPAKRPLPNQTHILHEQQDILTRMSQFYVQTQHVKVRRDVQTLFIKKKPGQPDAEQT